jgi:hypothetical protein
MSERSLKGTWKKKPKKSSKFSSIVLGMVYRSENYVGLLVSIQDEVATLQTKQKQLIEVDLNSLKIIVNE